MRKTVSIFLAVILAVALMLPFASSVSAAGTDILQDKKVLVVGDDISAGWSDVERGYGGWGRRLEDKFGMDATLAHTPSGVSISDWRKGASGVIHRQVSDRSEKYFDYILLHGGMADAEILDKNDPNSIVGTVVGAVKPNDFEIPYEPAKMAAGSFADGVERLIINAIAKYDGARIGFIINYATPNNKTENARNMDKYWEAARQVCDKWNIPYLDLYAGKAPDGKSYSYDILDMDNPSSPNHNNNKHLKPAGYEAITPYIAQWMTTIQPYNLKATLATAPTTTRKTGKTLPTTTTTTKGVTTTTGKVTTATVADGSGSVTTTSGNKGGIVAAGNGEVVTRKTTTTTAATADEMASTSDDTVKIVLIVCICGVVLVASGIVTALLVRKRNHNGKREAP